MVNFFIQRPIFSAVISIIITIVGALCIAVLPVSQPTSLKRNMPCGSVCPGGGAAGAATKPVAAGSKWQPPPPPVNVALPGPPAPLAGTVVPS